jgi:hypothetical protein
LDVWEGDLKGASRKIPEVSSFRRIACSEGGFMQCRLRQQGGQDR